MPVADIYARKSSVDHGRSAASQVDECREDIEDESWQVGRVFADPDRSASRFARKPRPDYQELVAHIEAGNCEILALWESSRGARDMEDWVKLLNLCRHRGVLIRIQSHGRTYDVRNRRDMKTLLEDGISSQDEAEIISARARRGMRQAAKNGRPHGQLLYGYRRRYDARGNYEEQVIDEEQATIVREMAARVRVGESLASIAADLNARGILGPRGGRWTGNFVGRVVTKPAYVARRIHLGTEHVGKWPPILDEATWRACVVRLSDPKRRTQRGTALKWFLSGVPVCTRCEGTMRTFRGNHARRYLCQQCGATAIKAAGLDEFVAAMVKARLRDPTVLALFTAPPDDAAVLAARAAETDLRNRLEAHYDDAAKGKLSHGGLVAMETRLLPAIADAAARVATLSTPPALRDLAGVDVSAEWDQLGVVQQRNVVSAVCAIRVGPGVPGRVWFDRWRLADSRWTGDCQTWGQIWHAA